MMSLKIITQISRIKKSIHNLLFWKPQKTDDISAEQFVRFMSESISSDDRVSRNTIKNIERTVCLLMTFNQTHQSSFFDEMYVEQFASWLKSKGYHGNTIAKHMSIIRTYYNRAIRKGLVSNVMLFNNFRIRTQPSHYSFLTPDELAILENYSDKMAEQNGTSHKTTHCLFAFLFCCYTGLRFSDFINMSPSNIVDEATGKWLDYESVKTHVHVRVPIGLSFNGKAEKILELYNNSIEFFNLPPNPTTNRHLAFAASSAGLSKHISFHTARHTNATLLIYYGLSIVTVQKLLGHKNIRTTTGYCDIMDQTIMQELGKASFL